MRAAVTSVLKIERGEGFRVLRFALLAAALQAGLAVGTGAADSLFLNGVGPGGLPIVYLLTPAMMLVYIPLYSYLTRRLGMQRLLRLTIAALVVGGVAMTALLTTGRGAAWVLYAAKLYTSLWFVAQYSVYWNFTDEYFDILDSKRLFPLLTSGSAIGAMTGGVLLSLLSHRVPTPLLFTLWSLLAAAALPLAVLIERRYRTAAAAAASDDEPRLLEVFDTIGSAMRGSRHVRLYVAVGFMSFLTAAVCEFQYMTLFSAGRTEAELTALFGRMFVAVNAFNLVFGLFLLNRLILRLGVPNMALVQPGAFLVAFAFLLIAPGFETAVLGFFVYQGLMPAVTYDTHNLLLNAAPATVKAHVRTFVDGLAEPGAVAISGLFLLLGAASLGGERVSVIGVALAGLYVMLVLLMKSGYTGAMVQNLRRGWLDLANPPEHLLARLPEADVASLERFVEAGDAAGARAAIGILWLNDKRAAVGALLAFLDRSGRDQRQAMRALVAQVLEDGDPEVAGPLIEWVHARDLRDLGPALVEELGARGLVRADQARALGQSGSAEERAAGAVALIQSGTLEDTLAGTQIVQGLLATASGTAAGVRALGFSGQPQYAYAVVPFAHHPLPAVRREAVAALGRLVSPAQHLLSADVLAAVRDGTPEERMDAMDVLARLGDPSTIPPLLRVADRFTMLERRRAEAAILRFGSQSVPVLVTVLRDRSCPFAGRAVAARALGKQALPQLELLAAPLIVDEIEHAYRGVWRWSRLDGSASTPGVETLKRYYLDVRRDVVEFVLQVLAVSGRVPNVELLSASLASDNPKERADAIETIEQGVTTPLFRALLPLIDQRPPSAQAAYYERSRTAASLAPMQVLEAALQGTWLERLIAAQALCEAGPAGIARLRERLDTLEPEIAREAFGAISRDPADAAALTHVEKIHYLRRSSFFARLGIQEVHVLVREASVAQPGDGTIIFSRGDFADSLYCVIDGHVDVRRNGQVRRRSSGDVFGEAGLRGEFLRGEDATSRGARLLVIATEPLLVAARNHPRVATVIFRHALEAQPA